MSARQAKRWRIGSLATNPQYGAKKRGSQYHITSRKPSITWHNYATRSWNTYHVQDVEVTTLSYSNNGNHIGSTVSTLWHRMASTENLTSWLPKTRDFTSTTPLMCQWDEHWYWCTDRNKDGTVLTNIHVPPRLWRIYPIFSSGIPWFECMTLS